MRNLLKFIQGPTIKELVRCHIPEYLSIAQKTRLLEGVVNLQFSFISDDIMVHMELIYAGQPWKFELNGTHHISFHTGCLWIPKPNTEELIPFHINYISEMYVTSTT